MRCLFFIRGTLAISTAILLASCSSGGGGLPQSHNSGTVPQSTGKASCDFSSAALSERLRTSSACSIRIARAAHRSRAPLSLASSRGITTFDVPNAATASICLPFELFTDCGTNAAAINDAGTVTGFYLDSSLDVVGFIRSTGGRFTSFEAGVTVPHAGTVPETISDTGTIGGQFIPQDFVAYHGWIREADGTLLNADAPFATNDPTSPNTQGSYVASINVRGDAAGIWFDAQGKSRSFIRSADGSFLNVVPPNAIGSGVCPIGCLNNGGALIGGFAVGDGTELVYTRSATGTITEFGAPGAPFTEPSGINAGGETSGYYYDSNFLQWGFTRNLGGTLSGFQAPNADRSPFNGTNVDAINDAGAVTGVYFDSSGAPHGFYRSPAGQFAEFDPANSVATIPTSINASGEVVGIWLDAQGQTHGFLWLPL